MFTRSRILIALGGAITAIIILIAGGYLYWQSTQNEQALLQKANQDQALAQQKANKNQKKALTEQTDSSGWRIYLDDTYGFEFRYPNEMSITQLGEGNICLYPASNSIPTSQDCHNNFIRIESFFFDDGLIEEWRAKNYPELYARLYANPSPQPYDKKEQIGPNSWLFGHVETSQYHQGWKIYEFLHPIRPLNLTISEYEPYGMIDIIQILSTFKFIDVIPSAGD
ncbi:MAG: hypothetical protein A3A80_03595 [Candidatus Terrybacteria bacterium RIFCSPLOWO2_01_FULL_44_24]|uniref:Uncharacterized protein n=1 Tax=Candidatus Terrybacteria bacterium RIFCSPHIGHO2_01_FULL_43_35 TaxID=1802361 RepID=A0A1G2PDL3_9BACT|nr:MAG: hypothetical protein A2828_00515 [Candidatus Terrybacteria bacterium RIFCSPHIGHO2_01_FULL_43_35]OHA49766.1 MAG: hypothetical protein A3B75_02090 [Candidatus Terrybacteria bacterium RIFCSPHIGHO2_02_FULL_43_14]OHA51588.1 MAG: hypothetical protein A3A80_03595 [Candidatus Terrybacteria bacterium RIFCSPLOWO2_01_FULL_44_24]